jgi:hypothetical protein
VQAREERCLARLVEVRVGVALLPRRDLPPTAALSARPRDHSLPPTAALSARPRDHSRATTSRRLVRPGPEREHNACRPGCPGGAAMAACGGQKEGLRPDLSPAARPLRAPPPRRPQHARALAPEACPAHARLRSHRRLVAPAPRGSLCSARQGLRTMACARGARRTRPDGVDCAAHARRGLEQLSGYAARPQRALAPRAPRAPRGGRARRRAERGSPCVAPGLVQGEQKGAAQQNREASGQATAQRDALHTSFVLSRSAVSLRWGQRAERGRGKGGRPEAAVPDCGGPACGVTQQRLLARESECPQRWLRRAL